MSFPLVPGPDSLRAVLDSVFAAPEYRWIERPHPFAFISRWWIALGDWLARMQARHPDLFLLLFWALVVILVVIFVHGIWVMTRAIKAAGAGADVAGAPLPAARDAAWYRREAARLARLGAYVEAMQNDFLGLVLELDQRRLLRFHPSKTPGEYATDNLLPDLTRPAFRDVVRGLYGHAFAGRPCGAADFAAWHELTAPDRYAGAH
ncbi:MAG TPA: DUF4129 domain-containing protein [Gemmatimonadales bacterium]|nr:DUF4129 domain-containing protein [Gemmatimonadales bacterium]